MYYYLNKENGDLIDSSSRKYGDTLQQLTRLEYDIFHLVYKHGQSDVLVSLNKIVLIYEKYSDK